MDQLARAFKLEISKIKNKIRVKEALDNYLFLESQPDKFAT